MEKLLILYNQGSGEDKGQQLAKKFAEKAKIKYPELQLDLKEIGAKIDSQPIVEQAMNEAVDTLVIIGGDGTISHTIDDFKELLPKVTIGILPGGTVNNMAKALKISANFDEATETILAGHSQSFDYGLVNGKPMISTLTIGILADTAAKISQKEKQKYGSFIFMRNFIHLLRKRKRYHLIIEANGTTWQGKTQLVAVTLTNSVGGFTHFNNRASADDGLFHLMILPRVSLFRLLWYVPRVLRGKVYEIPELSYEAAEEITIKSYKEKKIATRVDGDARDDFPIELTMVKSGLQVFVPENVKKNT